MNFVTIFVVFLLAYAIARFAILQPDVKSTVEYLKVMFGLPYLEIYANTIWDSVTGILDMISAKVLILIGNIRHLKF